MTDSATLIQVDHQGDTILPEVDLWLDPHRKRPFAFVSHAHADHFAAHGKIVTSTPTRKLIEQRFSAKKCEFLSLDFGEIHDLENGYQIKMLPAGHIAGSAMLHITRQYDGATLLHTGDFKLRRGLAAERCQPEHADTLIMETTFGIPKFTLPASELVISQIAKFAIETIEENEIPIFLAYSLGKAQEIILAIHDRAPELPFQLHHTVAKMTHSLSELGYHFPNFTEFDPDKTLRYGHIMIAPPAVVRSKAMMAIRERTRIAMISGWGVDSSAKYRYQTDEVFPLSDHAGYDDLHEFVKMVEPSRVLTIHGYTHEFARDLRAKGIDAWPLQGETQLELNLDDSTLLGERFNRVRSSIQPSLVALNEQSEFGKFTAHWLKTGKANGKGQKRGLLANFLTEWTNEESLAIAVNLLSGSISSPSFAVIRRALLEISGLSHGEYKQIASSQLEAARTAPRLLEGKTKPIPHTFAEVSDFFTQLSQTKAPAAKIELLANQLRQLHPSEGGLIISILSGELSIELPEALVEEAVAKAFEKTSIEIHEAHQITSDLGEVAVLAKNNQLRNLKLTWFTPLKTRLEKPTKKLFAQLHKKGERVEIYGLNRVAIHEQFPDLIEAALAIPDDIILKGEIVAIENQCDLFAGKAQSAKFIAHGLLALNGKSLLKESPEKRQKKLTALNSALNPTGQK